MAEKGHWTSWAILARQTHKQPGTLTAVHTHRPGLLKTQWARPGTDSLNPELMRPQVTLQPAADLNSH